MFLLRSLSMWPKLLTKSPERYVKWVHGTVLAVSLLMILSLLSYLAFSITVMAVVEPIQIGLSFLLLGIAVACFGFSFMRWRGMSWTVEDEGIFSSTKCETVCVTHFSHVAPL